MATLYSDTGDRQNDALSQAGKLVKTGDLVTGNVQIATATHTVNAGGGNDATNDIVRMVQIPAGCRILWDQATINHEAMGSAYTVKIGTPDDDDAGGSSLDIKAAGIQRLSATATGNGSVLASNTWVVVTLTTVTTATAGKKLTVNIPYAAAA